MKYINEREAESLYNDWLDEVYPPVNVGVTLSPSYVLRECDPTAYRCGLIDWLDSENLTTDEDEADDEEEDDE